MGPEIPKGCQEQPLSKIQYLGYKLATCHPFLEKITGIPNLGVKSPEALNECQSKESLSQSLIRKTGGGLASSQFHAFRSSNDESTVNIFLARKTRGNVTLRQEIIKAMIAWENQEIAVWGSCRFKDSLKPICFVEGGAFSFDLQSIHEGMVKTAKGTFIGLIVNTENEYIEPLNRGWEIAVALPDLLEVINALATANVDNTALKTGTPPSDLELKYELLTPEELTKAINWVNSTS